jgi:hypothetical protein
MAGRRIVVLSIALAMAPVLARSSDAAGTITVDAGYSVFRRAAMLSCTYEAPAPWYVTISAGGWYWPAFDVSTYSPTTGYTMNDVFDGDAFLAAGYAFRLLDGLTLSAGVYAGAWFYASRDSIASARYAIYATDDGILLAPRAGVQADVRWFVFRGLGLHLRVAAPWQLFQFTALGLSEGYPQIGLEAGISWRFPLP